MPAGYYIQPIDMQPFYSPPNATLRLGIRVSLVGLLLVLMPILLPWS